MLQTKHFGREPRPSLAVIPQVHVKPSVSNLQTTIHVILLQRNRDFQVAMLGIQAKGRFLIRQNKF